MPCFYRPIVRPTSVLYIFHVAGCKYVLLDWERAMNAHRSIHATRERKLASPYMVIAQNSIYLNLTPCLTFSNVRTCRYIIMYVYNYDYSYPQSWDEVNI